MEREQLKELIELHIDKQVNRLLKWIIAMVAGGVLSLLTGGVFIGTTLSRVAVLEQEAPTVEDLKKWKTSYEATPRVTPEQAHSLDKRLEMMEYKLDALLANRQVSK